MSFVLGAAGMLSWIVAVPPAVNVSISADEMAPRRRSPLTVVITAPLPAVALMP
jgi:hypothetical protein